jgi:hypothetical protein
MAIALINGMINEKLKAQEAFRMPEWVPKRQILHPSIVCYEITYIKKRRV